MAKYKDAVEWIALNDDSHTCPENNFTWQEAFEWVHSQITTALVTDIFDKDQAQVTTDILKARGFKNV